MTRSVLHLYIDDSGSRDPDREGAQPRRDRMDHFALGGILVQPEDIDAIYAAYRAFCSRWSIDYPLHSTKIRGSRSNFAWLATDMTTRDQFLSELETFLLALPIIGTATVVDRPGYVSRYGAYYQERTWLMCKTAFSILVERAAKFAHSRGRQLEIFFEAVGKKEDEAIKAYGRELKSAGMPFNTGRSAGYGALMADDFRSIILGEPRERTKKAPMIQLADLILYPIAKGAYDPGYTPFQRLIERGLLIDAHVPADKRGLLGIKYSCFDGQIRQDPALAGS